ncbi:retrovirus-related pol polyprotein from transposon TNT 1-94 [Tanacetum coccineum]
MSVLPDDQMNSIINYETAKATWEDLILYNEGPSNVKESRVMDLRLCYNTFKFKEGETLTQTFTRYKAFMNELVNDDFKLSKLDINTGFINKLLKKSQVSTKVLETLTMLKILSLLLFLFFSSSQQKPELRPTKDFEAKYNKFKAKLAFFSSGASTSKFSMVKSKGLVAEAYEWDEEDVFSDDNEMVEIKVPMALADDENIAVGKESARNGEWVKISIIKVHTLLEMEDNDERKTFIDYLCIDLNYVEEQRNNLVLKYKDLVQELNTCKEQLLIQKHAKLDFLTMQHVNTEILKVNKNLRKELKELTAVTETWLNSSNKVNQCISEQISSQKKIILGVDQLAEDPSSSRQTELVFVKSSADDNIVYIPGVERPWLSEAEGFNLPNHDTGRILPPESQVKLTDSSVQVTDSSVRVTDYSVTDYDSADESSVCSTLLSPLEKLDGAETCDIRKPIRYMNSGCSRHMTSVKSYMHKYVEQPGPKVVFGDDSTCTTEGYGSIKYNAGKQNLIIGLPSLFYSKDKPCLSCEKGKHQRASFKTKQTSSIKKCLHLLHMDLFGPVTPRSVNHENYTLVIVDEYSRINILISFYDEKGISQNFSFPYTLEQNGVVERKNKTLIEATRTMLSGSVFSKQYWTEVVATACYTQNWAFNTRRQQTEETYHITFDESTEAIKFSKPFVDDINIAELERYPPN